jgi:ERCC4-related helicase
MSLGVRQPGRSKRKNRARVLSLATLGSRDWFYGTPVKRKRQELHAKIARAIEERLIGLFPV